MTERKADQVDESMSLIKNRLLEWMPDPGRYTTKVPGVCISRRDEAHTPENCFYEPVAALVVQGRKRSIIGTDEYIYGDGDCLVAGVDMPSISSVTVASPQAPFLAVSLALDPYAISKLAAEVPPEAPCPCGHKAIAISPADRNLLDAFIRLLDLLEKPDQAKILAPMVIREIHYRLLIGPWGGLLRSLNTLGTQGNQVAKAVTWLRENYKEQLQVDDLARKVNMAPSTFHRHFRQVTTLSPLQFQKRLRLYEAERLMLATGADAGSAALEVGYESPNQFNREYKRLFGEPPRRDISRKKAHDYVAGPAM